ncbi:MAG: copper amine oxidase N-terminal domain-containing protein [Clostridia bacterium]|nr:copper amine oxidase N-terminal domain-containing protein [Clostridia bacterium]
MKSKLLYVCAAGSLVLSALIGGCIVTSADNIMDTNIVMTIDSPVMRLNGEDVNIDENGTSPIIANGRTLVPIRAIAEALGGSVEWNNAERTITITKEDKTI